MYCTRHSIIMNIINGNSFVNQPAHEGTSKWKKRCYQDQIIQHLPLNRHGLNKLLSWRHGPTLPQGIVEHATGYCLHITSLFIHMVTHTHTHGHTIVTHTHIHTYTPPLTGEMFPLRQRQTKLVHKRQSHSLHGHVCNVEMRTPLNQDTIIRIMCKFELLPEMRAPPFIRRKICDVWHF